MGKKRVLPIGLLAAVAAFGFCTETDVFNLSRESGVYRSDVRLEFHSTDSSLKFQYRFKESKSAAFVSYRIPILLSALQGEERTYTLVVQALEGNILKEEREYAFVIDKRSPSPPSATPPEGEYSGDQTLKFIHDGDVKIFYSFNEKTEISFTPWDGLPIPLKGGSEGGEVTIYAYSEDRAGNRSTASAFKYRFKSGEERKRDRFLSVLSPVQGVFLNPQTLYIGHEGYDWIKYSTDGSDPETGQDYLGPRKLEGSGKMILKVAARKSDDGGTDRSEIVFEQYSVPGVVLEDGSFETEVSADLTKAGSEYTYCLEERTPKAYDAPAVKEIPLELTKGAVRTLPIRIKSLKENTNGEFRFFFVLDGRVPGPVDIACDGFEPVTQGRMLRLNSSPGTSIRYTLDGKEPDFSSPLFEKPIALSLPEEEAGSLVVKARAFLGQTKAGPVAEKKISYSTKSPLVKSVRTGDKRVSGIAFIAAEYDPGLEAVFELAWDGKDPPIPTAKSPRTSDHLVIQVPYGLSRDVSVRAGLLDRAGNLSVHPEVFRFSLHRIPPPMPQVFIQDNVVTIQSKERCLFRLREAGIPQGILDSLDFQPYGAPVALPAPAGKRVEYSVEAYSEDDLGNRSEVAGPFFHLSDRRVPKIPGISTREEGVKLYKDDCVLDFSYRPKDLELFYSVSENGNEPPNPDSSSPKIDERLVFKGKEGRELSYWVKVLSRYADSPERGDIADFRFVVDRLPPERPEVLGMPEKSTVNHGIEISISTRREDERVFYRIRRSSSADSQKGEFRPYEEPIRLEAEDNETVRYEVDYEIRDPAGNSYISGEPLVCIVDREAPTPPAFKMTTQGVTKLELSSEEGTIYFEYANGGRLPAAPGPRSRLYREPLSAGTDAFDVYSIAAVVVDEAGNLSKPLIIGDMVNRPEILLTRPESSVVRVGNRILVSWKDQGDDAVFFAEKRDEQLKLYEAPILLQITAERGRTFVYRTLKGEDFEIPIPVKNEVLPPLAESSPSGRSASTVAVKNETKGGEVHYEIGVNGAPPKPVTRFSPLFDQTLEFKASDGETATYSLELRSFDPFGIEKEKFNRYSFTVDRTPPLPPIIEGVMNDHYYVDDRTIVLKSGEGSILVDFREISSHDSNAEALHPGKFSSYERPLIAAASEGTMKSFVVHAISEDSVGNRSISVTSLVFTIDKAVVYLSLSGNDEQEGSRSLPFKSLQKALSVLRSGKRTAIHLAKGTYPCETAIESFKNYSIVGSFEESTWRKTSEASIIQFPVPSTGPGIVVDGKELVFESIVFAGGQTGDEGFMRVGTGALRLTDCSVRLSGRNRALVQTGGKVLISRTTMMSEDLGIGELILALGGYLEIKGSTLSFTRCEQSALLAMKHPADVVIDESTLSCGEGLVTTGIHSLGAMLKTTDVKIHAGKGSLASLGIKCDGGTSSFDKLTLYLSENAYISTGISSVSGAIDVKKSHISLVGRYGATGIYLKNGSALVTDSVFEAGSCDDFLYHIHCEGGSAVLSGNSFSGGSSGDFIGAVLQDSSSVWKQNSMTLGKGRVSSSGIMLKGKSPLIAESNRIVFPNSAGVFFVIPKETLTVKIEGNRFSGEKGVLLRAEDPSGGWSRVPAIISVRDADSLNSLSRPEGIFAGNVSN